MDFNFILWEKYEFAQIFLELTYIYRTAQTQSQSLELEFLKWALIQELDCVSFYFYFLE